jgi:hypothetical protein
MTPEKEKNPEFDLLGSSLRQKGLLPDPAASPFKETALYFRYSVKSLGQIQFFA